jgi:hypothetical protein
MPSSLRTSASTVIAVLGVLFALIDGLAVIGVIRNGISQSKAIVMTNGVGNPEQLGAVFGEAIIAIAVLSLFALLPAVLLYLALGPMRLRAKWFYLCTLGAGIYFLVLIPVATIFGIVLLVALRRRRGEFTVNPTLPNLALDRYS